MVVVSELAFNFDHPSSNPAEVDSFNYVQNRGREKPILTFSLEVLAKLDYLNKSNTGPLFLSLCILVNVIKLFWKKSRKSRFPLKAKQQEYAILKAINSFGV